MSVCKILFACLLCLCPLTYSYADSRVSYALVEAADYAQHHALNHSHLQCWHYVKDALITAGVVNSRPNSIYAYQASKELVEKYGFTKLNITNPYLAPVGSVLVYKGHGAGHVEIRTRQGFASDYHSRFACFYPLIGIYAK